MSFRNRLKKLESTIGSNDIRSQVRSDAETIELARMFAVRMVDNNSESKSYWDYVSPDDVPSDLDGVPPQLVAQFIEAYEWGIEANPASCDTMR